MNVSPFVRAACSRRAALRRLAGSGLALTLAAAEARRAPLPAAQAAPADASTSPAQFLWQLTDGIRSLSMPQAVTIAPDGNLWVLDMAHHEFQIFTPDGAFVTAWGSQGSGHGEFSFYAGPIDPYTEDGGDVAFDRQGAFYVADLANYRIQKFAPDRSFLFAWGGQGRGDGQFLRPFALAVDAADNVYVADFRRNDVQAFASDGTYLRTVVTSGAGQDQTTDLGSLSIGPDGRLWVADWSRGAVLRFSPDGVFESVWGSLGDGPGLFSSPTISAAPDGHIYVADGDNDRIQVLEPNGRLAAMWGSAGTDPGQFRYPTDVAVDGRGHVYVTDFANNRLQAFRLALSPLPATAPASS